jgi:hypothetical protein
MTDGWPNIERWLDEQPPDYPEVYVKLIDALRDYIRNCDVIGRELLQEGAITRERFDEVHKRDAALSHHAR